MIHQEVLVDSSVKNKRDRSLTERKIKTAAYQLFAEKGFKSTTIRMISEKSGCNVTLISRYFGSKKNLFKTIIEEEFKTFSRQRIDSRETESLSEELKYFFRESMDMLYNNERFYRLIIRETITEAWYGKIVETVHKDGEDLLKKRLCRLIENNYIESSIDPEKMSHMIFHFLSGLILRYLMFYYRRIDDLEEEICFFIETVCR